MSVLIAAIVGVSCDDPVTNMIGKKTSALAWLILVPDWSDNIA